MHEGELPSGAFTFLRTVAKEPEGLCTSWMWEEGRSGFSSTAGDIFRACSHRDLVEIRAERFVLTDAGIELLGLSAYHAADPSTWSEQRAEKFYLRGYCHALAIALSRRYGFEIGIYVSGGLPLHAFAIDAGGDPVDFDGPTTRERIKADCGTRRGTFLTLADEADLAPYIGGHNLLQPIGEGDVAIAARYVAGRPDKFQPRTAPRP